MIHTGALFYSVCILYSVSNHCFFCISVLMCERSFILTIFDSVSGLFFRHTEAVWCLYVFFISILPSYKGHNTYFGLFVPNVTSFRYFGNMSCFSFVRYTIDHCVLLLH